LGTAAALMFTAGHIGAHECHSAWSEVLGRVAMQVFVR
jgi:hypothetical protein